MIGDSARPDSVSEASVEVLRCIAVVLMRLVLLLHDSAVRWRQHLLLLRVVLDQMLLQWGIVGHLCVGIAVAQQVLSWRGWGCHGAVTLLFYPDRVGPGWGRVVAGVPVDHAVVLTPSVVALHGGAVGRGLVLVRGSTWLGHLRFFVVEIQATTGLADKLSEKKTILEEK